MISFTDSESSPYLDPERLSDILALIQVLAFNEKSHRSENGLNIELQGIPKSAKTWEGVAKKNIQSFFE
jgi:hypothetical protein